MKKPPSKKAIISAINDRYGLVAGDVELVKFDFDLIEVAKILDTRNRSIIVNRLNAPFFP
ncbi:hypothetical protein HC723_16050 [Vibrio sp. S11_S32]|uniref:hypothetical protein n=1 Tax=Vibrio sp. S11_S32 TaxID=2720225 RepID=UPI0016811562|nr:hypothetical protein [Vibrio sp. S11_S32]MBD1577908.1 hypothetical protein [Vibrio sp. S11_S32]